MAPISPSTSFLLPINRRGSFFEDVFFQDAREDFHHAIRDVLTRRDRGRGGDRKRDLSCYRKLRQEDDFDEDSQALTITEDDNNRKILLDVKEFHPDGDVKVHAVTDRELLVEGHHHDRKTGRALSFSKTFMLPWYADLSCGYFSVDISSDGVLRIITTKKAPSTGRSIPLVIECEAITEDEFNQENCVNNNILNNTSSRNSSSNRKESMSTNGSQKESYNYTNGTVNSNTESVHCTSQDTTREVPQNNKKGKIIPIAIVKNESNKGSEKVSQSFSPDQESVTASSNQNGSVQYSSNSRNSSSSPSSKNRLIKTVITTTFDVKSNSDQGIPAKQQEIVIPVKIDKKNSSQEKDNEKVIKQPQPNNITTFSKEKSSKPQEIVIPIKIEPKSSGPQTIDKSNMQQQSNRNTTGSNIKSSFPIPNLVNTNQKFEDSSSQNSKVQQTVEKKKDKSKDTDSAKSKTPKNMCLNILNKKPKANTSDKHKKDITNNHKQRTYPKEFVIPLTIEGESSDDIPFKKDPIKKVDKGKHDQSKNSTGKKPPINQKVKPKSPLPKKLIISNVFKGQEEQENEMKRGRSSDNKPPLVPRHERSSSIEDKVSVFTRMSPVAERKSRKDIMDEIRGNNRGARSRSRSIEELVSKFDKMSPSIERGVLMRKNSQERTESLEKTQFVKKKESIIPIEIEGYTEKNHSDLGQDNFHKPFPKNISSSNGKCNRLEENENKELINTQRIKPIVKRKESIIPIKLEYEENENDSFAATISNVSSSIDEMINQINNEHSLTDSTFGADCKNTTNKGFSTDTLKTTNINEKDEENTCTSTPNKKSITEEISYNFSPSCISNDTTPEKYSKIDNDNGSVSSVSSPSVIEDVNSLEFAEETQQKAKDKTKKSSKKKVKRKQSIPGVQVSDDETGEMTVLLSKKSTSSSGRNNKKVESPTGPLEDEANHSLLNDVGKACDVNNRLTNNLTGFSNVNIANTNESSDKVIKETSSNIPEVKDPTNLSELNGTNSSNLSLQTDRSNSCNLNNSMSDSPLSKVYLNNENILTKNVHDYSSLRNTSEEHSRKGKAYKRTYVNQLVSDDSGSDGGSSHQSRSEFRESRASVRLSSKNRSDESPVKQCIDNKTDSNSSNVTESSGNEKINLNSGVIPTCPGFEISNKNIPPEDNNAGAIEAKKSIEASNEKIESRRSSVLPSPSDLLKIKPPKKNKKEKLETIESSQNCKAESNENESTETNMKELNESRRASILPNPTDLLKIKPPKKNKKENMPINESCQTDNDESSNKDQNTNDFRRSSVLPNPADLLKIKPPKKSSNELKAPITKSVSSENSENSKSSQDSQKPKDETTTDHKQPENPAESQKIQSSKNIDSLKNKVDIITEKVNENKDLEKIPENSLNPETVSNPENNTVQLEVPQTPSLRRKTSFKKYKVFENKRTPSPSPVRRPDTLASPKPEQNLINKIEESSTDKKEETNNRKEEKPLIKEEPSSLSKNSKKNTCVTIDNKDMFFSDPSFKDHRQLFMGGVREALKRSGITSMRDKLRVYRDLRLKGATEDNQAICSAEDETSYKAVLDMTEFLEGEIKVKTMSSTEIVIEGTSKGSDKSTPFTHSLPFPDSIKMEAVEASLSEDGILAINAPKTNPDTED